MSFEAEKLYNEKYRSKKDRLKLKVLVVEKNTNAIVTLRFMNEKAYVWLYRLQFHLLDVFSWRNRCTIVESDMRSLPAVVDQMDFPKPDLIVSELLGSFGDNEVSFFSNYLHIIICFSWVLNVLMVWQTFWSHLQSVFHHRTLVI